MSAIQQLLTDHIDIWTDADTEKKSGRGRSSGNAASVYGIKKLRELILELAVRGKLVPQDPDDEPASELLKKIQVEKAQLITERKIKKEKPFFPISENDVPFDIPSGWVLVRLGDIAFSQAGFAFKSNGFNEAELGLPLIRIRDVGQAFTGTYFEGEYREEFVVEAGDYLISMDGEFRVAKWLNERALLNQRVSRLIFFSNDLEKTFVAASLQANLQELQGVKAYTTVDHLSGGQISNSIIALPPRTEQHRIVAKVDELMALCDQLETQHINAAEAHENLVSQLLATLTQSQNTDEFSENWQRIAAHFDTLFTTESSVDALKQTLLQLAVMGKLTNATPERENVELKDLYELIDGDRGANYPKAHEYLESGFCLFLSTKNVRKGYFLFDECQFISEEKHKSMRQGLMRRGDIVITTRGTLGNTAVYDETISYDVVRINSGMLILRPKSSAVIAAFTIIFIQSPLFDNQLQEKRSGSAQPQIPAGVLKTFEVPLFSTHDQNNIVAKVDDLMALCDQLKSRITEANRLQQKLADVVVEQALSSEFQPEEADVPKRNEARALLGAEIIHQLHTEKTFGQVKLQKIVHLCEYIAGIEAVAGEYQRYAAGPHDPDVIVDIESSIQQNEWYEEFQRDKFGHAYRPLSHAGEHRKKLGTYWQTKLPTIQKLIDVMRKWDTERCEIFSTLYAAWNDLLIFGKPVSDDAILSEVLERWNESKTKIPRKNWLEGLEWMRKEGFIPKGSGRATRAEGLFD
jgi:type I restriction enzyme, S subunit